jgi:hypothetical protein
MLSGAEVSCAGARVSIVVRCRQVKLARRFETVAREHKRHSRVGERMREAQRCTVASCDWLNMARESAAECREGPRGFSCVAGERQRLQESARQIASTSAVVASLANCGGGMGAYL